MKKKALYISQQQDQSDCGVVCLQSLLRHYGGDKSLEELRKLSGTNQQGTTLLGLYQAANQLGFKAEGCQADAHAIVDHAAPVILHVVTEASQQHYVICYAAQHNQFTIADPSTGEITVWDEQTLLNRWQSHTCLTLKPVNITQVSDEQKLQRQYLWQLIKPDIAVLSIAAALGLAIALLGLTMALFSQQLIDVILPEEQTRKLVLGIFLVGFLLVARTFLQRIRQTFLARQGRDFNNRINQDFYRSLLHLPKSFFDTRKTGELVARLNDTLRIQRVLAQVSGNVVIELMTILVSLVFIFSYSWQVGTLALFTLPILFFLAYRYNQPIISKQKEAMQAYAQSESFYVNSMQGIHAIKQFNQQKSFSKTQQVIFGLYQNQVYDLSLLNIKLGFSAGVAGVLFLASMLGLTGDLVLTGEFLIGEMMAVLGIAGSLIPAVTNLALLSVPINEARVAFERMYEFVRVPPEPSAGFQLDSINSIQFNTISFRYPGRSTLLSNINFSCAKGDVVLVQGANGSGKSTLMQLLQRFYQPESGQIIVNNQHVMSQVNLSTLRKKIGVIDQDIPIFNGSLTENLLIAYTDKDSNKLDEYLRSSGFDQFFKEYPQGYATLLGEEGLNLSGGQKQLIGLCRALMRQPEVLILDEPETALDNEVLTFILLKLQEVKEHTILFICTHKKERFLTLGTTKNLVL